MGDRAQVSGFGWVMNAGGRGVAGVCNARGVNASLPPGGALGA